MIVIIIIPGKKVNNFKIKYSRTSQKASCVSVLGPKL